MVSRQTGCNAAWYASINRFALRNICEAVKFCSGIKTSKNRNSNIRIFAIIICRTPKVNRRSVNNL